MSELSQQFGRDSIVTSDLDHSDFRLLSESEPARIDLRQSWRTIRQYLWLLVSAPLILISFVAVKDLMATPLYTAQATILIKNTAPQVFDYATLDSSSGSPGASASAWDIDSKTEYQLLNARSLATKVIVTEDLWENPAFVHGKIKPHTSLD